MKIMQSPTDLDEWESEQVAITRAIDENHRGASVFCKFMIGKMNMVKLATLSGGPLPLWQRAAYEAHIRGIRSGDAVEKTTAEALWAFVQYLQKEYELGMRPEIVEYIKGILSDDDGGFDFSKLRED